jgi:hypothetical protein
MYRQDETTKNDNELADFTDRVLQGKIDHNASSSDGELIGLEKTILRLTNAFPSDPLEDAKSKQMLVRLKARMRREEEAAKPSFWKRLFDLQSNPQVGLLVVAAMVVVLLVVSLPSIQQPPGSSVSGTSISGTSLFTVLGLAGVLVIIYWISRRK